MGASKYLYNKTAFSYIAAKITNFNNNAVLPPYDTTISDNSVLSKYQDRMKFLAFQTTEEERWSQVGSNHYLGIRNALFYPLNYGTIEKDLINYINKSKLF